MTALHDEGAIDDEAVRILDEKDYDQSMRTLVLPTLDRVKTEGWMEPAQHKGLADLPAPPQSHEGRLFYTSYLHDKEDQGQAPDQVEPAEPTAEGKESQAAPCHRKQLVILHGFTDTIPRYHELIYYFYQAGFDVWMMEHRGHGLSPHDSPDTNVVYIDDWRRYVLDQAKFVTEIVRPHGDGDLVLYAHSMGGGIGLSLLEQYPDLFDRAVFSSPMVEPQMGGISVKQATAMANIFCFFGQGKKRVFAQGEFSQTMDRHEPDGYSYPRVVWKFQTRLQNVGYQLSAAAYQWVRESVRMSRSLLEQNNIARIKTPFILFQAEKDTYVSLPKQDEFLAKLDQANASNPAGGPGRKIFMTGAQHDYSQATNDILEPVVRQSIAFLGGTDKRERMEKPEEADKREGNR